MRHGPHPRRFAPRPLPRRAGEANDWQSFVYRLHAGCGDDERERTCAAAGHDRGRTSVVVSVAWSTVGGVEVPTAASDWTIYCPLRLRAASADRLVGWWA